MEPGTQASWQADPTGRHEHRYWDGQRWTDNVSDDGATGTDPYDATAAATATASSSAPEPGTASAVPPATPSSPTTAIGDRKPSRGTGVGPSLFVGALAVLAVIVVLAIISNL